MKTSIVLILAALTLGACASSQAGRQTTALDSTATQTRSTPELATKGHDMAGMKGHDKPGGMKGHDMAGGMKGHDMAAMCPMAVEGTTARAEDVDGGAALAFTTTGDVAELRRRVAHMAEMHEQHHRDGHAAHGEGHGPMMHRDAKMGMMGDGMAMPPATARSVDIEGGARLILTPKDPAALAQLREHTRRHAEKMASGQCPMMSMHHGAGAAPAKLDEHPGHRHQGGN
jgi:hypothetical protein